MTISQSELMADLLHFVQSRGARHAEVTSHTDLLDSGLLDSLLLVDLISHIEEVSGIRIDGDQVKPSNFRSIVAIVDFLLRTRVPREPE
jgi:acyl carrier protein